MATDEHGAQDNAHPDLGVLAGGVAVVTGGASGIGLALVEKAIDSGMHAVIADIEAPAIADAESRLADAASAAGVEVFGHRVDVSSEADVLKLEAAVSDRFPDRPVALLCCNAGVGGGDMRMGAHHDARTPVAELTHGHLLRGRLAMYVDQRGIHDTAERMGLQHRLDGRERIVEGPPHEDLAQRLRHQHLAATRGVKDPRPLPRGSLGIVQRAENTRLTLDELKHVALIEGVIAQR